MFNVAEEQKANPLVCPSFQASAFVAEQCRETGKRLPQVLAAVL
jgi:hypothetical protein